MKANRILTTVSVFALATAAGVTGAAAQTLQVDLTGIVPVLDAPNKSDSIAFASQLNLNTKINAVNSITLLGTPDDPGSHDVDFGTISDLVIDNSISATAIGNMADQSVDLFTATGTGDTSAATIGTSQFNSNTGTASIDSLTTGAQVRSDFQDLGKGSTVGVITNSLLADTSGNISDATVKGDINPLLASTQEGASTLSPLGLEAAATVLVGTSQINVDIDTPTATITGSRIGLLATVDNPADVIDSSSLTLADNVVQARIAGNDADNTVAIGDGKATALEGSAGISNLQINVDQSLAYSALVGDNIPDQTVNGVIIEIGDNANGTAIADLKGSAVDFTGNAMRALSTSNAADNALTLADGVTLVPQNAVGDQQNAAVNGGGSAVKADLFIHSGQTTLASTNAVLAVAEEFTPLMLVDTGDLDGAVVTADGNAMVSAATGNRADNDLVVAGAAEFTGVVAINSAQLNFALQNAVSVPILIVDVAMGPDDTKVVGSEVTVDGNLISDRSIGNQQSSALAITGTDVSGTGFAADPGFGVSIDRPSGTDAVIADFSVLNIQLMDSDDTPNLAGALTFVLDTAIWLEVGFGADVVEFKNSSLSTSGNLAVTVAAANLATDPAVSPAKPDAGIDIVANTFTGTVALVNDQTVLNSASIRAAMLPAQGVLFFAGAESDALDGSKIAVDRNTMRTQAWGNVADASVNAIDITATTISDGAPGKFSGAGVERDATAVTSTEVSQGIVLVNDQSVEDLDDGILRATGEAGAWIQAHGIDATDLSVSLDGNAFLVTATANDAASRAGVTATTLNAATALVNVQTLADEDDDGGSGTIEAILGEQVMMLDTIADTYAGVDMDVIGNSMTVEGRVNTAVNELSIATTKLVVENLVGGDPTTAVLAAATTGGHAEALLLNDQFIDSLDGLSTTAQPTGFQAFIADGSEFVDGTINIDGNLLKVLAQGNEAANTLSLKAGTTDLSLADDGAPANGPVAAIVSNQSGVDASGGINILMNKGNAGDVNIGAWDADLLEDSGFSISDNVFEATAGSNKVANVLDVGGTSFAGGGVGSTPTAEVIGTGFPADVEVSDSAFTIASRQVNDYDVTVLAANANMIANAFLADTITGSDFTVDNNLMTFAARGNEAANRATSKFTDNGAQTMVVNYQAPTESAPEMSVSLEWARIAGDLGDRNTNVFSESSLSVSGNRIEGSASAHRSWNTLTATGTNVAGISGASPSATVETGAGPDVSVTADFAIVNVQGAPSVGSAVSNTVKVSMSDTIIDAALNDFQSGSLTVNNNVIIGSGVDASAVNTLTLKAGASAGIDGATAAIVSQQILSGADFVDVFVNTPRVGVTMFAIASMEDEGSASATVAGNKVGAEAIGGIAINTLDVSGGAGVTGSAPTPVTSMGDVTNDPVTLEADYSILNVQLTGDDNNDPSRVRASLGPSNTTNHIGLMMGSGALNDSLSVDNNALSAAANGFIADNRLYLDGGAAVDANAIVANLQGNGFDGQMSQVQAFVQNLYVDVMVETGGLENSGLSVSNNSATAIAGGNSAVNLLSVTAGASLQGGSGAGASIVPAAPTPITVGGADYTVLNHQYLDGEADSVQSNVFGVFVGVDGMADGVNDSTVEVDGNVVGSVAIGNQATNVLVLNTGTFEHPAGAIANLQTTDHVIVSATVEDVTIGIGETLTIDAVSDNSRFSVTNNKVSATAIGNYSANVIRSGGD